MIKKIDFRILFKHKKNVMYGFLFVGIVIIALGSTFPDLFFGLDKSVLNIPEIEDGGEEKRQGRDDSDGLEEVGIDRVKAGEGVSEDQDVQSFEGGPVSEFFSQKELIEAFDLNEKVPGTKLFYSDALGFGFTYINAGWEEWGVSDDYPRVVELGNKVTLDSQSIEVFWKSSEVSLKEAIEERFLEGYDSEDCFVVVRVDDSERIYMDISFPHENEVGEPWWANGEKCPQEYSETNGATGFFMVKEFPDRFFFYRMGQAVDALDGSPGSIKDWMDSFRILR
jgi:hypothetical protein